MGVAENRKIVDQLWESLYRKDWDGVKACLSDDAHYEDVPAPDSGAHGPDNIVRRLRIGLDPVVRFEHEIHRIVSEADAVVVEHTETWHFDTDEKIVNHFVTVHSIADGKIALWRDYWDINTLMSQAPQWWLDRIAKFSQEDFS